MKQQDIAVVIIVVFIAGVASYFLSNKLISPAEPMKSYKISKVSSEFDASTLGSYINPSAIDPTVRIEIRSDDKKDQPFAGDSSGAN